MQQDFLFACAAYPEEEPFGGEVEAEAREQVTRLAAHPVAGALDRQQREHLGLARLGLAGAAGRAHLGRAATTSTCCPGSSTSWTRPARTGRAARGRAPRTIHPNDPAHGTTHIWDVWNTDDYPKYREYVPRFVAEFGYQAPPAYATLRRALSDEPLAHDSPGMAHHQKAADGDAKLQRGLDAHLPAPADFDDWHYLTQLNQARAIQLGVEHFRSHRDVCSGTIVWQLNDCWPVTSWSAVDGDGRRKPLWYALRRAYADRLLTVQPRDGGLALIAVNETGTPWRAPVTVTRTTLTGEPRAKTSYPLDVPAYAAVTVPLPVDLAVAEEGRRELLVAEAGDTAERALWFFAEDRDAQWPAARVRRDGGAGRRRAAGPGHRPYGAARPDALPGPARPGRRGRRGAGHPAAGGVGHVHGDLRCAAGPGGADRPAGAALRQRPGRRRGPGLLTPPMRSARVDAFRVRRRAPPLVSEGQP